MKKKTIRAREFVMEDECGNERASLGTDGDGNAVLLFRDNENHVRLFAGVTKAGTPRINLNYADGKGSIQLEANDKLNTAALMICGPGGKVQVMIGIAKCGLPAIALLDAEGNVIFPPNAVASSVDGGDPMAGFDWDDLLKR